MTPPATGQSRSSHKGRLRRGLLVIAVVIGVVGIAGLAAWGFMAGRGEAEKEAERDRPIQVPSRVTEMDGQPAVRLDAGTRKRSGITVAALPSAPYQPQVQGFGTVLDPTQLTDLANSFAGARAQQQAAQARLAASTAALDRARGLYRNQQNVSLAQLQAAEASFQADQAALAAADSQVRTVAATAAQAFGPVLGKALVDGSDLAGRLIARKDVLLQVTLPPGISAAPPPTATVGAEGGGPPIPIRLVSPAPRTDPRLQDLSFLYLASASSAVLPGMNLLVSLPSGPSSDGVALPASAIVWWQDRAWIYREATAAADTFVRTEIPTDLPAPEGGYVVAGLPKGALVVTRGAQALLSEEFRAQLHGDAD